MSTILSANHAMECNQMITEFPTGQQDTTRERLLAAGMRLFAAKGFSATSVGEIEAAVGLQPRRGALYRHYPSKAALLETSIERYFESMQGVATDLIMTPEMQPRQVAMVFGQWMLNTLDAQREMTHIIEREGERLKPLRDRFRQISNAGFSATAQLIERWLQSSNVKLDPQVASVILVGAIVNFRRSNWTFGGPPLDVDDERFLAELALLVERMLST